MVDFIVNNYVIIMIVAVFLIFALIGFAVDTTKNRKNKEAEILTEVNEEEVPADIVASEEVANESEEPAVTETANEIPEADSVNMNMDN